MPPLPDLVRDSEFAKTAIHGKVTRHFFAIAGKSSRQRRIWQEQRWQQADFLGKGTYGEVWKEVSILSEEGRPQTRAVKVIRRTAQESASFDYVRELEAVAKFSQEKYRTCFVQAYGWFRTEHTIHIAMEFLQYGDLQSYLSRTSPRLPEPQVQQITFQLLEGLQFMHENDFVHRDLKPSNILIREPGPDWWVKIGDFGISKRAVEGTVCRTFTGTPGFLAPEILARQGLIDAKVYDEIDAYTSAVDMWSLGEIVFRSLCGQPTFDSLAKMTAYVKGNSHLPLDQLRVNLKITGKGCDFITRVLEIQSQLRLDASEALRHPWVASLAEVSSSPPEALVQSAHDTEQRNPFDAVDSSTIIESEPSANWSTVDHAFVRTALRHPSAAQGILQVGLERPIHESPQTDERKSIDRVEAQDRRAGTPRREAESRKDSQYRKTKRDKRRYQEEVGEGVEAKEKYMGNPTPSHEAPAHNDSTGDSTLRQHSSQNTRKEQNVVPTEQLPMLGPKENWASIAYDPWDLPKWHSTSKNIRSSSDDGWSVEARLPLDALGAHRREKSREQPTSKQSPSRNFLSALVDGLIHSKRGGTNRSKS